MKRIGKLARPVGHDTTTHNLHQGLQAMWEDRWMLLGVNGKAEWLQRHGALPSDEGPHASPLLRAVRRLLDGYPDVAYGALRQRIRAAF